jgi:amidase
MLYFISYYVRDGYSVITTAIDAGGMDHSGQIQANRPNPMTGPFYVEEAEVIRWNVDLGQGIARLADPNPALSNLKLPLASFLGCFGVAPSLG